MPRHLVIGGGTAGINAIRSIREEDGGASEIILVSAERPYSRMVLPYYLGRSIAESHVFTATPVKLAQWGVKSYLGRSAAALDPKAGKLTLDDGAVVEYDDCLIATGSSAVRPPIPGADGPGIHTFWTLEQARGVIREIASGSHVVMVGAGFIAFTILNSVLALGARLTVVEIEPRILPRMIDAAGARIVEAWLRKHGVEIRTSATLTKMEESGGQRRLHFKDGSEVVADCVILATGIKTNLAWLDGSGIRVNRGVVVDDHLRSNVPNVYAAGDVAEGRNLVTGALEVHAIEPTAMEHGRVVGANMAGRDVAYRGSLLMNVVGVLKLEIASFGAWDDPSAEVVAAVRPDRAAYRKLLFTGDRLTGAMLAGQSEEVWATNDVGMLKGLVQSGVRLAPWKEHLRRNPFDIKPAFIASLTTERLLPQTVIGRPSLTPGRAGA
ncbi:MAG: NAD(P)/FAD-dependent oxidoreductase, partial [Candidatus Rokubacteria bacterium]|nr:NAD(P)/FAD-dependent oxidoreductase [Candidatus Rokubacteria bacterium]